MTRVIVLPIALVLSAAHCTSRPPAPLDQKPEPPPPPAKVVEVPAGFALEHFGQAPDLRALIKVTDPELDKLWTDGDLVLVRRQSERCVFVRRGHRVEPLIPCPKAADPKAAMQSLDLVPTRFAQVLVEGSLIVPKGKLEGSVRVPSAWVQALLAPLGLPEVELEAELEVSVYGSEEGTGVALEFGVNEELLERLGRFDLSKRYGGFPDYVSDVRAWGDGSSFQWIVRLDGGGAGVRLVGRRLRLAVHTGEAWKAALDNLLRATEASPGLIPLLTIEGLSLKSLPDAKLRPTAQEKALPTRPVLGQLAARLKRWLAEVKEEP